MRYSPRYGTTRWVCAGTRTGPSEYGPSLIVDADRMLARQIALEPLKAIPRELLATNGTKRVWVKINPGFDKAGR